MPAGGAFPGAVPDRLGKVRRADDIGEHERHPRRAGDGAPVRLVTLLAFEDTDVDLGAETAELLERRRPLEVGIILVAEHAERTGQHGTGPRDLVRRAPLTPRLDRSSQLS